MCAILFVTQISFICYCSSTSLSSESLVNHNSTVQITQQEFFTMISENIHSLLV